MKVMEIGTQLFCSCALLHFAIIMHYTHDYYHMHDDHDALQLEPFELYFFHPVLKVAPQ